jgi:hypothetical protein
MITLRPRFRWRATAKGAAIGLTLATGGCITVKAPEKPIVIELNVTIKQEVVYRLAGDAAQTIDKNAEIF